jgi:hypothetical protein
VKSRDFSGKFHIFSPLEIAESKSFFRMIIPTVLLATQMLEE